MTRSAEVVGTEGEPVAEELEHVVVAGRVVELALGHERKATLSA